MTDRDSDQQALWFRDNQRHLTLVAGAVAAQLDERPLDGEQPAQAAELLAAQVRAETGREVALDRLSRLFGLTAFERDILVAVSAPELGLSAAIGPVTFGRALGALADPHWSALLPDGPLRGWRLVDTPAQLSATEYGRGLAQLPLTADERILHALVGAQTLDQRLAGRARLATDVCRLPQQYGMVTRSLAAQIAPAPNVEGALLTGEDRLTRRQTVIEAARLIGLTVLLVDAGDLPNDAPTTDALARLLARECGLGRRALLIEVAGSGADPVDPARALRLLAARAGYGAPAVISTDDLPAAAELPVLRIAPSSPADRQEVFRAALSAAGVPHGSAGDFDPVDLAERHPLTPAGIWLGVERAVRGAAAGPIDLDATCRTIAERPLHALATVRRATARLSELVLPETTTRPLHALLAQVRGRRLVYGEWGFGGNARGRAVTALFTGPSGTGKTTAAEAVAAELGLDVIAADLSQVVSKYIGETEKHLARLFDAAEAGAVLLFDEGDALFAKRTQVRDSRDRYANLEVSYLLQRLENFGGIAILTTNARDSIDAAFTRRMRFIVTFPFPDTAGRAQLWQRIFPAGVPTVGLDSDRLAQLAVSGGTIAQIALQAAFLAADAGRPVDMSHILHASRIECDKIDRPLSPAETRGWVPS